MARAFSVAALAIAEGGANAVGAVRFTCAEAELEVELVRVAGYAEGFALGAVAAPVRFGVPYTAIRGLFPSRFAIGLIGRRRVHSFPHETLVRLAA